MPTLQNQNNCLNTIEGSFYIGTENFNLQVVIESFDSQGTHKGKHVAETVFASVRKLLNSPATYFFE